MSKVTKKFHLDTDGYLTTKPDHQLTTEEEATDAAEAAIEEALEEGGAIAEAIAANGGGGEIKQFHANLKSAVSTDSTNNATLSYADRNYVGSPYDKLFDMISLDPNGSYPYGHGVIDYSIIMVIVNPYGGGGQNMSSLFYPCYASADQVWFKGTWLGNDTIIMVNKSGTVDVKTVSNS